MICPHKRQCKLYDDCSETCNRTGGEYYEDRDAGCKREMDSKKSKKIILGMFFMFAFMFMLVGGVGAVGTYPALDPNMVLYYHFNNQSAYGENDTYVYDFSGNGNNGIANNTEFQVGTGILGDGSFYFNGVNSSVNISSTISSINYTKNFTISGWFYKSALGETHIFSQSRSSSDRFDITVTDNSIKIGYYNGASYLGNKYGSISSNGWYNFIYSYSNGTGNLTLNGVEQTGTGSNPSAKIGTNVIYLGVPADKSNYFNGSIDEIIVWNKTLSQSEKESIYQNYVTCGSNPIDGCNIYGNTNFNKGIYYFNSTIHVYSNNLVIDGNGSTIILGNITGFDTRNMNNITIKNITLVSNINSSNYFYGLFSINSTNITLINSNFSFNCNTACFGTRIETSSNINISNNIFYVNGTGSYGIYLTNYVNNSFVYLNNIYTNFIHSWGIHLEFNASYNQVYNNTINTDSTSSAGIYLEEASYNNVYNNFINSTLTNGIQIEAGSINNNVYTNTIYSGLTGIRIQEDDPSYGHSNNNNIYNNFINGGSYGVVILNLQTNNSVYNNFITNPVLYGINFRHGAFSNFVYNNSIQMLNSSGFNYYSINSSTNNSFYGSFGLQSYFEGNSTNYFFNLTSSLLHNTTSLCNGSTNLVTGSANITLNPNQYCYVLDNFNLTEGVSRQYSPIWFSSSSDTEKHIASNLSGSVTTTLVMNVQSCSNIGNIKQTSPSGYTKLYQKGVFTSDYTCENNVVTILDVLIEPSAESNEFTIAYDCDAFTLLGYKLIAIFSALIILSFCIGFVWLRWNKGTFDVGSIMVLFIGIIVSLVLYVALSDQIALSCPVS